MLLNNFDYNLPKELIADSHIKPRDHSRLLVLDRKSGEIEHRHFYDVLDYLKKGDVLVFRNSKVFKARIYGRKETEGKIEILLIRPVERENAGAALRGRPNSDWEALVRGKVKVGDKINFDQVSENNPEVRPAGLPPGRTSGHKLEAEIIEKRERSCLVKFNLLSSDVFKYLENKGELPLPPYIRENSKSQILNSKQIPSSKSQTTNKMARYQDDNSFYQTIYANPDKIGSVAAPTAGFHFTPELIKKIKEKGVEILFVTLHVGPGTFLPVEAENIEEHKMHEEFFEVEKEVWDRIVEAKKDGRRVVAVGTTTARVLETLGGNPKLQVSNPKQISNPKSQKLETGSFDHLLEIRNLKLEINEDGYFKSEKILSRGKETLCGKTNIFIYPPYDFKIIDGLITNFHLPKSTLLMLVSAFAGSEKIKKAYAEAIQKKYRFYSFGDSMFINTNNSNLPAGRQV